jgi:hypothetical protein
MNLNHYTGAPGFQNHSTTGSVNDGNWRQLVWTYVVGSGKAAMYIDGDLDHEKTLYWYTSSKDFPSNIGCIGRTYNGGYWDGDIAYVALYRDALTASEVSRMFQAQRHRFNV